MPTLDSRLKICMLQWPCTPYGMYKHVEHRQSMGHKQHRCAHKTNNFRKCTVKHVCDSIGSGKVFFGSSSCAKGMKTTNWVLQFVKVSIAGAVPHWIADVFANSLLIHEWSYGKNLWTCVEQGNESSSLYGPSEGRDGVWSSPLNKFNSNTWLDYYIWMYSCVCHGMFSCQWWWETTELMMAEAWRCACSSPKSSLSNLSTRSAGKIFPAWFFFLS